MAEEGGFLSLIHFTDDERPLDVLKKCLAEFLGTGILVGVGCLGNVGTLGSIPFYMQPSITFGLAVMISVAAFGHISGAHLNPSVTVAAVVAGQKSILGAIWYLISQSLGAVFGYGLIKIMTPVLAAIDSTPDYFCVTEIQKDLSLYQGFLSEVIATMILVFLVCSVMDPRNVNNTDSTAIKFGLAVTGLCLAFGPYTGCSMNPVRSLAPAIFTKNWSDQWLYWCAPISGALIGSVLYQACLQPSKDAAGVA